MMASRINERIKFMFNLVNYKTFTTKTKSKQLSISDFCFCARFDQEKRS